MFNVQGNGSILKISSHYQIRTGGGGVGVGWGWGFYKLYKKIPNLMENTKRLTLKFSEEMRAEARIFIFI